MRTQRTGVRRAEVLVGEGKVKVNGVVAQIGQVIDETKDGAPVYALRRQFLDPRGPHQVHQQQVADDAIAVQLIVSSRLG